MVEVQLDYELTEEVRSRIWRSREKWGKEFHRTDLVYCKLKPYCRLTGVEARVKREVVESWLIGEIGHQLIQRAFKLTEVKREFQGAQVHYDVILPGEGGRIMEVKTSTLNILNASQIPKEYLEQCVYGMVFSQHREALLLTLDLNSKLLLVWRISIAKEELEEWTERFIKQKNSIIEAVEKGDPGSLTPKYEECVTCMYGYSGGCPKFRKVTGE